LHVGARLGHPPNPFAMADPDRLQRHFERAYTAIFRAPLCGLASKKASNLAVGPQSP
jgi:hypothetical protein